MSNGINATGEARQLRKVTKQSTTTEGHMNRPGTAPILAAIISLAPSFPVQPSSLIQRTMRCNG